MILVAATLIIIGAMCDIASAVFRHQEKPWLVARVAAAIFLWTGLALLVWAT